MKQSMKLLLTGFRLAKDLMVKKLAIYFDSQLITNQTSGEYAAKHPRMARYLEKLREELATFQTYTLTRVPQAKNAHANALASLGSVLDHQLRCSIMIEYLEKPSIDEEPASKVAQISMASSWKDPIINYIVNGTLPADKLEYRKLQIKAVHYYMWNDMLVRRSFSRPHLCYLSPPDDLKILSSIHEGVYGNHSEGRSLVQKALNAGYYWLTMHQDAKEYVQRCDSVLSLCSHYLPTNFIRRQAHDHSCNERLTW
ncbi:uncharacterized protein [Malus domestica]|uniref:uncharacterized protein n=1 Tax=Malus domestica TaxID=3750 RepID=UPI0039754B07